MRIPCVVLAVVATLLLSSDAGAQQRPLATEDPEVVGAGRLLIEGGLDLSHNQRYPVSGLRGNLLRLPVVGVSVGISSIAELQIDGGFNRLAINQREAAPLSKLLAVDGDSTHAVEDIVIGTKIRLRSESATRPSLGFRFVTRLPNASNESGLGLDTTDFLATILAAKTVQSVRVVGNIGMGILGDPTQGNRQNDALIYGASVARAITNTAEFVGELNGRVSTRAGDPFPGTETRGTLNLGGRYTRGPIRFDGAIFLGMTSVDPTIGVSAGFTYVFHAFDVP